jgi:2-hydroxy-3-keto-5-methylthiopentenyl-1-phosphate phosphatase
LSTPNTIAIICDFDDTLGDDTTNLLLKEKLGMNEQEISSFWNRDVGELVEQGWDPPLAYIHLILNRLEKSKLKLSNSDLRDLGKKVYLFPGVQDLFPRLTSYVDKSKEFVEAHVQIEFYVITAGLEEIIRGTSISSDTKDIFGCTFDDSTGDLIPKSIVTFTEKTKFLYAINKGISGSELRRNPYSVNDVVENDQRRIPFSNIVYIGDGPTDIPCFSTVHQNGGKTIGVLKYEKKAGNEIVDKRRAWAIACGDRDRATLGPYRPDYTKDSDMYVNLLLQVERVALEIVDSYMRRG